MDKESQHIEQIEQYLLGSLSASEVTAIETRLQHDETFRKEVEEYRTFMEAVKETEVMDFREMLEKVATETQKLQKTNVRPFFMRLSPMAIAAAVTIFAALAFLFINDDKPDTDQIFASNYQHFPRFDSVRGDEDTTKKPGWVAHYNGSQEDKYEKTLDQLSALPPTPENQFYIGMCHLGMKNYDKAIVTLHDVLTLPGKDYKEEARWYLALAYLKTEKISEAKKLLKEIADTKIPTYKQRDAREILKKL